MEHWLPLFHERLDTLFDYLPGSPVVLEPLAEDAARERLDQIADYYEARQQALGQRGSRAALQAAAAGPALSRRGRMARAARRGARWRGSRRSRCRKAQGRGDRCRHPAGPQFRGRAHRARPQRVRGGDRARPRRCRPARKRVVIALWSEGARERMSHVLADHGLANLTPVPSWPDALQLPKPQVALAVLGLESGFETADAAVISEQDILGDRLVRPRRGRQAAGEFHRRGDEPRGRRSRRARRSRHRPLRRAARHRGRRRAARLPRDPLRRRRQAVPAGREHRAAVALRLGGDRRRARPARRRRLADAQGAHEEAASARSPTS